MVQVSQRIRYQKTRNGILTSRRNFTITSGQEVRVELDLNSKKYRILDSVTGEEIVPASGNTKNISVLKIQSKRALSALGVQFVEEKRDRESATVGSTT